MNEQLGKVIVGSMLRKMRESNGQAQRDVAAELGLPNPNYLSMIEKGTNFIPVKRLSDFGHAYGLDNAQSLAIIKMTNPDVWNAIIQALSLAGLTDSQLEKINKDVKKAINEAAKDTGVDLLE